MSRQSARLVGPVSLMAPRLVLAVAGVWMTVATMFAASMWWTGPSRHPPRPPATSELARMLNASTASDRRWRWSVTRAQASQGALVVEADVIDLEEALASARAIVEPVRGRYSEVLIYLRRTGAPGRFAARRVQWTPAGGFVETALQDGP